MFYALSSIISEQNSKINELVKSLKKIFGEKVIEEDLLKVYQDKAKIHFEKNNEKIYCYFKNHNSKIYLESIDENDKEKLDKILNKDKELPNLLECLFKMKLSNDDEPLLLWGPTCYKTYASKIILNNGYLDSLDKEFRNKTNIVSLNQESTISKLLDSSFFYSPLEAKKFYLRQIYKILGIPDVEIDLKEWENKKDKEILKKIFNKLNEEIDLDLEKWEKNKNQKEILKKIYSTKEITQFTETVKNLVIKFNSEEEINEKV